MFSLSTADLDRRILDCAGGASSFTAEVSENGGAIYSVDPLYAQPIDVIERKAWAGVAQASNNVRADPAAYDWSYMEHPDSHFMVRSSAARRFLTHKSEAALHYLPAELPHLPFRARSFDLVICSHLLFTYANHLDAKFHILAIDEMFRVYNDEVRIYPLVGFTSDASSTLSKVLHHFDECSIFAEITDVDYCFQKGSGRMLRIHVDR
jgi:ubiquinone/menaquinone biosynthesis C-methylase UbiE